VRRILLKITRTLPGTVRNPVKALLLGAIRSYQLVISPGIPSRCKYYPSCSQYALDAVREYGAARGFVLAFWRVLRCNPLSYGGYDPVARQKLFRPRGSAAGRPEAVGCETIAGDAAPGHERHAAHGHLVRG
jgi:putative membrane protein insertion efficiency factor